MRIYWDMFIAFFRVGLLGFGGGPSSIPLVYKEVVARYKWMSDDEFGDVVALGNTLPGPIITKMAGYIGFRVLGFIGMILALIASVVPTILLMIILISSLNQIKEFDWVGGMISAVIPVVGIMMVSLTWQFFTKAKDGLGWMKTIIMCTIIILLLQLINVHPAIIIAALLFLAIIKKDKQVEKPTDKEEGTA